jgi:uncharacterized coiled-coil DUF342 family protein
MTPLEKKTDAFAENNLLTLYKEASQWQVELEFIALEIRFIKLFLESYPYPAQRPNLFERIQTFLHKLQNLKDRMASLHERINSHEKEINTIKKNAGEYFQFYRRHHEILKEEVNRLNEEYKQLKWEIYQYSEAIIED